MATELEYATAILKHFVNPSLLLPNEKMGYIGFAKSGEEYFLKASGRKPLDDLLISWWGNAVWHEKATFADYHNYASHYVLQNICNLNEAQMDREILYNLKDEINQFITTRNSDVSYIEGCHIIPYKSPSFDIGPVHFQNLEQFCIDSLEESDPVLSKEDFIDELRRSDVNWVASITLKDLLSGKGEEIATLAIDLALTSIQLLYPTDQAKGMRRFLALNVPHQQNKLRKGKLHWMSSLSNQSPGLSYGGDFFQAFFQEKKHLFVSYGHRIEGFCSQSEEKLNMAWCDAAYWFHEGIVEPIDTIAVTKLETCLEVLMRAEDARQSGAKILQALRIFTGKNADDPITTGSKISLRSLSNRLVSDRSRILHGTLSTLKHDARNNRATLTRISQLLLTEISVRMDEFKESPQYVDNHDQFLNWLEAQKHIIPC